MATRSCRKANRRGSDCLVPTRQRREVLLVAGGQLRPDGVPLRGDDGRRRGPGGTAARARPHGGDVPRLQRVPAQRHVLALPGAGSPAARRARGEPAHLLRPARGREERAHPRELLPRSHQPGSVAHGVRRARVAELLQGPALRLRGGALRRGGPAAGVRRLGPPEGRGQLRQVLRARQGGPHARAQGLPAHRLARCGGPHVPGVPSTRPPGARPCARARREPDVARHRGHHVRHPRRDAPARAPPRHPPGRARGPAAAFQVHHHQELLRAGVRILRARRRGRARGAGGREGAGAAARGHRPREPQAPHEPHDSAGEEPASAPGPPVREGRPA